MTTVINNFHLKSFLLNIQNLNCSSPQINLFWLWNVAAMYHGSFWFPFPVPSGLAPVIMRCLEENLTLRGEHWLLSGLWVHQQSLQPLPSAGISAARAWCWFWYGAAGSWDQTAGKQVCGCPSVSVCKTWTTFFSNHVKIFAIEGTWYHFQNNHLKLRSSPA